eukprot:jgi/Tetstr1/423475/TSEL_014156.t1
MWHQAIAEMAVAERVVPPRPEIYMPGRISGLGMLGAPRWAVSVFRRGAAKATSMQSYMSAINGFYRYHGVEHVAQAIAVLGMYVFYARGKETGEQPPDGFPWTSHSLRKGIAIAAYAFGVVLQKIKHFGGWVVFSSVVLDYIDPTALPCAASWQFFGWFTPWWGQHPTAACPPMGGMMTNAAPP